jgi:hypothetical protein
MKNDRYSRQGFLGEKSEVQIREGKIGIIGVGGGGSHVRQQLAHLGFVNLEIYDPDHVEDSNLNRMVGATAKDAEYKLLKTEVARKLTLELQPDANINCHAVRWQDKPEPLRCCQVIIGCVDGYKERRELEIFCRQNLIPLIDIGLDVHTVTGESPQMAGQVILSMPGFPCMKCFGFLTDEKLTKEAGAYGDAGIRPQVVWANGVLASTAVGIVVDLVTDWSKTLRNSVYLQYYANTMTMQQHPRAKALVLMDCPHFPLSKSGDVIVRLI